MSLPFVPLLQETEVYMPGVSREVKAWRAMVVCILLNRTSGGKARKVLDDLYRIAGSPAGMVLAYDNEEWRKALLSVLRPLGLQNRRAKLLRDFSERWNELRDPWTGEPNERLHQAVEDLEMPGIGEYARDCWDLLVRQRLALGDMDKELERLVRECEQQQGGNGLDDHSLRKALSWRAAQMFPERVRA